MKTQNFITVRTPFGKIKVGPGRTPSSGVTASTAKIKEIAERLIKEGVTLEPDPDDYPFYPVR